MKVNRLLKLYADEDILPNLNHCKAFEFRAGNQSNLQLEYNAANASRELDIGRSDALAQEVPPDWAAVHF